MKQLTPWERATQVEEEAIPGLFAPAATAPLSLFATIVFLILLWNPLGLAAIPTAVVFARMLALDLTTYTLPNIYTLPLVAIGFAHAALHGLFLQAVTAALLLIILSFALHHSRLKAGLGGGDLKLLAALFAFLPLTSAFWAIAFGCLIYMPVAMLKPKAMVPFGVPLIVGWVIILNWPHLPNWLLSTIS